MSTADVTTTTRTAGDPPTTDELGHHPRWATAHAELEVEQPVLAGYLAEFEDVESILNAAEKVRDAGFRLWDVHTPFPIHGMDEAMGIRPTILPWLVLAGGLFGLGGALLMEWWMNAHDYPYLVSGKPLFSLPAFIPVIFECTILVASFTAALGMLALNKLPTLYNPLFKSERFRRATNDRFFIAVDATDPKFDEAQTEQFLRSLGPVAIERYED
jgi:hypothetical protein